MKPHTVVCLAALWGSVGARVVLEADITSFERPSWTRTTRVQEGETVEVSFALRIQPERRTALEAKFWSVSDPFGDDYKKYLELSTVAALTFPFEDDKQPPHSFVLNWLHQQPGLLVGEATATKTRDLVVATLNAVAAESLFATELYHYVPVHYSGSKLNMVRAAAPYSLPDELATRVLLVDKLLRLPQLPSPARQQAWEKEAAAAAAAPSADTSPFDSCTGAGLKCVSSTNPAVLQARYGFVPLSNYTRGNAMAVTEFQLQGVDDDDLVQFADGCGVAHVAVDETQGMGGSAIPGLEALLDVEYIEAVAAPIPLTVINSISYSILDWATALNNDTQPAWVQSVSYGNDECQQVSADYMYTCNTQFMMAGVRGMSVMFASGDQGVWGRTGYDASGTFHPDFPASSPYITAVGGTEFAIYSTIGDERAWISSGGGFSDTFVAPDYQASAVAGYFRAASASLPPSSAYNATGRGYPDVSALAGPSNGYCVAARGRWSTVAGTSASCPVFAGAVAMLNDALLAQGAAPLGFLNPWLYQVAGPAGAFFDVKAGTNNGGFGAGFAAVSGWDPATGFGTPDFPALLKVATGSRV